MSFPITVHPYLCRSNYLSMSSSTGTKPAYCLPDFRPKCSWSPSKENQSQVMPLRVQLVKHIFYPLPMSQFHRLLTMSPSVRAVAHLHHLPVLASVERVELVGSNLVGRGWRGAVVFTPALRHVLLGLRECLLISWGDGVRECWNLHNIHTVFCLYEHLGKLFLVGMGQIHCDNYSKNHFYLKTISTPGAWWGCCPNTLKGPTLLLNSYPFFLSAVLNLLIPFPLAFSFCSFSLWDLVRLTGVYPSDCSSSLGAGRCLVCHQQLRHCPAWSKDREFRAVAEMGKRRLFIDCPAWSCSAHVSGKCFSSRAWQTASGSC